RCRRPAHLRLPHLAAHRRDPAALLARGPAAQVGAPLPARRTRPPEGDPLLADVSALRRFAERGAPRLLRGPPALAAVPRQPDLLGLRDVPAPGGPVLLRRPGAALVFGQ